jgi:hypothetical protein
VVLSIKWIGVPRKPIFVLGILLFHGNFVSDKKSSAGLEKNLAYQEMVLYYCNNINPLSPPGEVARELYSVDYLPVLSRGRFFLPKAQEHCNQS